MAKEIERKFLVTDMSFVDMSTGSYAIKQAYLNTDPDATVRVRVRDSQAFITIKSRNHGAVRNEWEYPIPLSDAIDMMSACRCRTLSKRRYIVPYGGLMWEVDVFDGTLSGLIVAEVELPTADTVPALPSFVGTEVTDDPAYYNSVLINRC